MGKRQYADDTFIQIDTQNRKTKSAKIEKGVTLVHIRGAIPTESYMRMMLATNAIIKQGIKSVKPSAGGGLWNWGGKKDGTVQHARVVVLDVAYPRGWKEQNELQESNAKSRTSEDGDFVLIEALSWSIINDVLNIPQKYSFMRDNTQDTVWSPTITHVFQEAYTYWTTYGTGTFFHRSFSDRRRANNLTEDSEKMFAVYIDPTVEFKADIYSTILQSISAEAAETAVALQGPDKV